MMRWVVYLLCLLPMAALAGDALDLDSIAGMYGRYFQDGTVTGESYQGEDILEIVKLSPRQVYFRTHLDFYNGHVCSLFGVAAVEGNALVYRASTTPGGTCVFKMVVAGGRITFADADHVCTRENCGERGNLDGTSFPLSARRPIRYMARLKSSWQYKSALATAGLK
jgi:hypothetical protein